YLMTDIAAATLLAGHPSDSWRPTLNGGMPTYNVYETADGLWMAVGALEPKFITILGEAMEWPELVDLMNDVGNWETVRSGLEVRFKTRCRDEWAALFVDLDACVSAVLSLDELAGDGLTKLFQVYSWESE
ncbi:MAG: hypothetical protein GY949_09190, partial [Gammaproteobacteria bacterium]|nr:hypothetical protein [Gammaproteobacteria bacterium]